MTSPNSTGAALPRENDLVGGKYVIKSLLGQGGMGAVYRAMHTELDKEVAIKVMLADTGNQEAMARFKNEGRAAAKIDSEHVVKVFDVGQEFGFQYMVLELLDGQDLGQVLEKQGKLPPHVVVGYMLQALRGVGKAHSKGIIHRDLKPSNLFLHKREDGTSIVKVLDFGISKASTGASPLQQAPSALTSTRAMLGSPLYMSPEQLRSSKSVDHRADIWALGVIMYELLTGELPFTGENLGELFAAILEQEAPALRLRSPEVPEALERVVLKCLQKRPENRYENVAQIAADIAPFEAPGAGLMATAFMPGAASIQAATRPVPGRSTPNGFVHTPSQQQIPPMAAVTPTGPRPAVGGTVAMGRGTNGGWQSTGSGQMVLPRSKAPIIAGAIFAFMVVVGAAGIFVYASRKSSGDTPTVGSSAPPPTSATVEPPPPASTPEPPEPPPSASVASTTPPPTPSETTTAATTPKPPSVPAKPPSHVSHKPPPTADPPATAKVEPKPPQTKPPQAKPPSTGAGVQESR